MIWKSFVALHNKTLIFKTEVYQEPKKLAELQLRVVETFVVISTRVIRKNEAILWPRLFLFYMNSFEVEMLSISIVLDRIGFDRLL